MKLEVKHFLVVTIALLCCIPFSSSNAIENELFITDYQCNKDREIGGAYLTFAGKFGGEITKADLQKYSKLDIHGCAHGSKIYQLTIVITKSGKESTESSKTDNLTRIMLAELRSLSKGDTFTFKKVKANLPNGRGSVDVTSRVFTIV
ncbi:hypothetical protein QQ008_13290 [Fulvivirgaceae bacterium BMA10]|uniref:Fimbrial protein n=1 Tax=Splendidivirga corallicola TaxID=3051826 RepID=A0ABT8KNR6_9BACT|nr:hypothetical protein [Fulvivirgaceae bacterium BMA10]